MPNVPGVLALRCGLFDRTLRTLQLGERTALQVTVKMSAGLAP
jgi:hypothetical protein